MDYRARIKRKELRALRESLGITPLEMAKLLKVTRQFVYRVESGERNPSIGMIRQWMYILGRDAKPELFFEFDQAA